MRGKLPRGVWSALPMKGMTNNWVYGCGLCPVVTEFVAHSPAELVIGGGSPKLEYDYVTKC